MFDRLVGGSVFAHPYAVVGEDVDDRKLHQRREPDRRFHVVGEDEVRGRVGTKTAETHAAGHGGHGMLPYAEMKVPPLPVVAGKAGRVGKIGLGGGPHVGGSSQKPRHAFSYGVYDGRVRRARGQGFRVVRKIGNVAVPSLGKPPLLNRLELAGKLRVFPGVALESLFPRSFRFFSPPRGLGHVGRNLLGDVKDRLRVPSVKFLGESYLLLSERRAVGFAGVLLVGASVRYVALQYDQRRSFGFVSRGTKSLFHRRKVVCVRNSLDVPAAAPEPKLGVLRVGKFRVPLDGYAVAVVYPREVPEPQVSRERGRLGGNALHHVPVAADGVNPVVGDVVAGAVVARGKPLARDGHSHGVGHALTQGPGRGLHSRGDSELRVSGTAAVKGAKALHVVYRDVVAVYVESGVEKHGGVSRREHEPVAVRPVGILRVVPYEPVEKQKRRGGESHGGSGMAGAGFFHRVHGERSYAVDYEIFQVFISGEREAFRL